jgi:hypothetical protein
MFDFIAHIKYRDPIGGWWSIGKVGAKPDGNEASVYLDVMFLGKCFAFPFPNCVLPYLHGSLMAFDGYENRDGHKASVWRRCGFISSHEADGTDWNGATAHGKQLYRLHLDALPLRLNKRESIVLSVRNE